MVLPRIMVSVSIFMIGHIDGASVLTRATNRTTHTINYTTTQKLAGYGSWKRRNERGAHTIDWISLQLTRREIVMVSDCEPCGITRNEEIAGRMTMSERGNGIEKRGVN